MTKIISISDEAYNELSKLKNGFSFSKLILFLAKMKSKERMMEFAGIINKEDADKMLLEIKKGRKEISRRLG